jgi:hypothetical protein
MEIMLNVGWFIEGTNLGILLEGLRKTIEELRIVGYLQSTYMADTLTS